LLDLRLDDTRLFLQLARGSALERLVFLDEPARERPMPFERRSAAANHQDRELARADREEHDVDGDGRSRVFVGVRQARTESCPRHTMSIIMKNIVITGSNTGIGRVTAETLARSGAHVWLANRSRDKTQPVLDAIAGEKKGTADFVPIDLADLDSVRA